MISPGAQSTSCYRLRLQRNGRGFPPGGVGAGQQQSALGPFRLMPSVPGACLENTLVLNRRFRGCSQIMVVKTPVQLPFEVIAICCLHQPNWWAMIPVPTAQPIAGSHPICAHRRHQRYRPPSFAPADSVAATNTIAMPRRRPCTNRKQWTARPGVIEPRTNAGYVSSPWLSPFCILI